LGQASFLSPLLPPLGTGLLPFRTPLPMSLPSDPSVFNILNVFRHHWFLLRDWLVSIIATTQQTDSSSIDWVKFLPAVYTYLVWCAIKLAPSVPTAKVKRVMFVYLLKVLNGDSPMLSFFTPHHICMPHKQRSCKPREGGAQPVGTMAVDSPPPVAMLEPNPPRLLSPGLVPGDRDPSSEEQAGNRFNPVSQQASVSPRVSPTPSNHTVMAISPLRPGPSHPPSVLGVKCSPPPASPFPPFSPPFLPSSPPPCCSTPATWLLQDWWDWIAEHHQLAGCSAKLVYVTDDDLAGVEGLLLVQVENTGPFSIPTLALAPVPPVVMGPPCPLPPMLTSTFLTTRCPHLLTPLALSLAGM